MKGRRKYKTERGYETVAPVPVNVSENEWTEKKKLVNEESKDVNPVNRVKLNQPTFVINSLVA